MSRRQTLRWAHCQCRVAFFGVPFSAWHPQSSAAMCSLLLHAAFKLLEFFSAECFECFQLTFYPSLQTVPSMLYVMKFICTDHWEKVVMHNKTLISKLLNFYSFLTVNSIGYRITPWKCLHHFTYVTSPLPLAIGIKSITDRDGAICRNNNHFERPTILNASWDAHTQNTHKHTDATKRIISPASRSIIIIKGGWYANHILKCNQSSTSRMD